MQGKDAPLWLKEEIERLPGDRLGNARGSNDRSDHAIALGGIVNETECRGQSANVAGNSLLVGVGPGPSRRAPAGIAGRGLALSW